MQITLAQINVTVGAIEKNTQQIIEVAQANHMSDLIVFPELVITGYPPEDLLLRPECISRTEAALEKILSANIPSTLIIGHPRQEKGQLFNSLSVIDQGQLIACYDKRYLPNYTVFDEARYFTPGRGSKVITVKNKRFGLLICEDAWYRELAEEYKDLGVDYLLAINASPFYLGKMAQRLDSASRITKATNLPMISVNLVGAQDGLIFDGRSFVINAQGQLIQSLASFKQDVRSMELALKIKKSQHEATSQEVELYQALVLAVRDYVYKNGFSGAYIGLSGGIDSALTLAVAVDALGADKVEAVIMPSQYTAAMSIEDAIAEAQALGVKYHQLAINECTQAIEATLKPIFHGMETGLAEENIQARARGILLMALSNKFGQLVLTTGNKSEMAVGYCTLYGDMAGGYCVLKDIYKTQVYRLARYRNEISPVIPERVITRAPSAELRPDQTDQESLPDYSMLDRILQCYIEARQSKQDIIRAGYPPEVVDKIIHLVKRNEYKRQQAPPGPKVTVSAFGKDWRYPITSGF